jgi:taurine dioxygenase
MTLTVQQLSPYIGARITGVNLRDDLDEATFETIRTTFNNNSVVVFPEQDITPGHHAAFSHRFGPLEQHVLKDYLLEDQPEIYVVSNVKDVGKPKGRAKAGWFWHSDLSYQEIPSLGSLLYALEVPNMGGDTMFASMFAAYDALSKPMQELLTDLSAEHDFRQGYEKYTKHWAEPISESAFAQRPPVEHPVIRTHPENGRKAIYVNPGYTTRIIGLSRQESDALLAFLTVHCTQPQFVYRHRWTVGDLVMWDNRSAMHQAIGDYGEARRYMHRTTVTGDTPF